MQDHLPVKQSSTMTMIVIVTIAVVMAAIGWFYLSDDSQPGPISAIPSPTLQSPGSTSAAPTIQQGVKPVYEPPKPVENVESLPPLNESDLGVLSAVQQLRSEGLLPLIVPQEVVRKFVMAVNNLEEGKVVHEYRPLVSPPPPFIPDKFSVMIEGTAADQERISPDNFQRYEAYVNALALIDPDAAAVVYKRFYPLLEEAFKELGLKKVNFHTVMIGAIDNILAAPDARGDLLLVHPKVFYQFADPALEALPPTHKLMLRMGPENARSVKASLRQLRAQLIKQ